LTFKVKKSANNAIIHAKNALVINKLIVLVVIHLLTEFMIQALDNVTVFQNIMMMDQKCAMHAIILALNVMADIMKINAPTVTLHLIDFLYPKLQDIVTVFQNTLTFKIKKSVNNAIIHAVNAQVVNKHIVPFVTNLLIEFMTQLQDNVTVFLNIMMMDKNFAMIVTILVLIVMMAIKKISALLVMLLLID